MSVISKLLGRLVSKQLLRYLKDNDLLLDLQSAYRAHHSTETVILGVLSDILSVLDSGNLVMLTLLDLSAAFDCVDHHMLLQRLRTSYGLGQKVINCMVYVVPQRPNTTSSHSDVQFDAIGSRLWNPARVGLGPILFLLYTADLLQLVKSYHLTPHAYADDTQTYMDTDSRLTPAVLLSGS